MVRVKQRRPLRYGRRLGFMRTYGPPSAFAMRRSRLRRRRGVKRRYMRPKGYGHGRPRRKQPLRLRGGRVLSRRHEMFKGPARIDGYVSRKLQVYRPPTESVPHPGSYENIYNLNTQIQDPSGDESYFTFPGTLHSWNFVPAQIVSFNDVCYQWREFRIAYVEVRLTVGERLRPTMQAEPPGEEVRQDQVRLTIADTDPSMPGSVTGTVDAMRPSLNPAYTRAGASSCKLWWSVKRNLDDKEKFPDTKFDVDKVPGYKAGVVGIGRPFCFGFVPTELNHRLLDPVGEIGDVDPTKAFLQTASYPAPSRWHRMTRTMGSLAESDMQYQPKYRGFHLLALKPKVPCGYLSLQIRARVQFRGWQPIVTADVPEGGND